MEETNHREGTAKEPHKSSKKHPEEEGNENLGLDSDHSSDTGYHQLNNDNDMISRTSKDPTEDDGESSALGRSPLEEK
ncbi:hypothetical protein [Pedobacter sp.]|uniref:hypothetical protein n=1 Tax=Pedobacter sp. TaxID=1411316 RepID=UPI003D7FB7E8